MYLRGEFTREESVSSRRDLEEHHSLLSQGKAASDEIKLKSGNVFAPNTGEIMEYRHQAFPEDRHVS